MIRVILSAGRRLAWPNCLSVILIRILFVINLSRSTRIRFRWFFYAYSWLRSRLKWRVARFQMYFFWRFLPMLKSLPLRISNWWRFRSFDDIPF